MKDKISWILEAEKHIGQKEYKNGDNPFIVDLWKAIKRGGIKDQKTPWCSAFVGAALERVGIKSSRFESAKSYLSWGIKLDQPVTGCIVVFTRDGGGHVGFVVGQDKAGNLQVLGGNQGDAVNVRTFSRARVTGYRWPDGVPVPTETLPTLSAAAFSKSES